MTKVKICGITNYEDAKCAANLGSDYLGFNFYKHSQRHIEKSKAKEIIKKLPKSVKKVGVFVNERISVIKETANFCRLDMIQLSGDERPSFIQNLKKALKKRIIMSIRIKDNLKKIFPKENFFRDNFFADYIMLDSFKRGLYGGTGTTFNWEIAENIDKEILFLSGGLNVRNIKLAIQEVKPYAVDVCSSIEMFPGKKCHNKMREFIETVKQTNEKILILD